MASHHFGTRSIDDASASRPSAVIPARSARTFEMVGRAPTISNTERELIWKGGKTTGPLEQAFAFRRIPARSAGIFGMVGSTPTIPECGNRRRASTCRPLPPDQGSKVHVPSRSFPILRDGHLPGAPSRPALPTGRSEAFRVLGRLTLPSLPLLFRWLTIPSQN